MFVFFFVFVAFQAISATEDFYFLPKNIDVDDILRNDRLTRNYLDCVLGRGKCTSEGERLRDAIPEALDSQCVRCNDVHLQGARKVFHHLIEHKPQWWREVSDKFDPHGDYKRKYSSYLDEEGLSY